MKNESKLLIEAIKIGNLAIIKELLNQGHRDNGAEKL